MRVLIALLLLVAPSGAQVARPDPGRITLRESRVVSWDVTGPLDAGVLELSADGVFVGEITDDRMAGVWAQSTVKALPAAPKRRKVVTGQVVKVYDGDTLTVIDATGARYSVRLKGIDAPELRQPEYGKEAQAALAVFAMGKRVKLVAPEPDPVYASRTLAHVILADCDLRKPACDASYVLLRAGAAWFYAKYADTLAAAVRKRYGVIAAKAKAAKLGLWAQENPVEPETWRRAQRAQQGR